MAKDFICGLILLALAAVYLYGANGMPVSLLDDAVGSSGFPVILGWALAVMSIVLLGQASVTRFTSNIEDKEPVFERPLYATLRAGGIVMLAAAFLLLLPLVGYICSLIFLIGAISLYQGQLPSWRIAAVAVGGAITLYLIFVRLLNIPLPSGFWPRFLG